jgi:hypothetical protein
MMVTVTGSPGWTPCPGALEANRTVRVYCDDGMPPRRTMSSTIRKILGSLFWRFAVVDATRAPSRAA